MTTMKTNDGSQYVLVLTKEQAELLGTFRFSHVGGSSPLYAVLRDLPHKMGARFRTEVETFNGKPIFHELIPAGVAGVRRGELLTQPMARPSGGKSMLDADLGLLEVLVLASLMKGAPIPPPRTVTGRMRLSDIPMPDNLPRRPLPDVLMDDQTARRVALTPEAQPKKWIVQYLEHGNSWVSCVGNGQIANSTYTSRNEAYRQMRARIKRYGTNPNSYRVVPSTTPGGPERDRGYYVVEYFRKVNRPLGWGRSESHWLRDTFPSAEGARLAINTHVPIADRHRYRVKWHPNRT
ncbi:hypothetical protein Prado_04 [Xylella phage Prado]|uniref:Uncharacterized protein n=1 Tax=Xylella phage Prado TaxID=1415146 RepID=V5Q7N2_9CAUD|nr:hypothetical protein Prado_04 [Xylella phage Prado]AHB12152.1 hypothetical protein Prado_04 [Xylella phage Prado]